MLKYEELEEQRKVEQYKEEQKQQAEFPAEAASQAEMTEQMIATLDSQERAQADMDREQEYAAKLMATVQTEARKFRKSQAMTRSVAICFGILMGLMLLLFVTHGLMRGKWDWDMLTSMTGMTGVIGIAAASSKTLKTAASELSTIEDLRAVGPLAESLQIEEKTVRTQVESALIRLLPRLQASDAYLLNTEQRACLNRVLQGKNDELIIAILRAYEQAGDETALPYVETLARKAPDNSMPARIAETAETLSDTRMEPKTSSLLPANVAEAAQACLPSLRIRVEQQRASQTLLRGASANSVAPGILLRAAQASAEIHPEQLLRPARNNVDTKT